MKIRKMLSVVFAVVLGAVTLSFGQEINCPKYREGDFWIISAKYENKSGSYSSSRLVNGEYKVIFENGRFFVQDFTSKSILSRFFPICSEEELIKPGMFVGMEWKTHANRTSNASGKTFSFDATTKVTSLKEVRIADDIYHVYNLTRFERQSNADNVDVTINYSYCPEVQSITSYETHDDKRPVTTNIILAGRGSQSDPDQIQLLSIGRPIDSILDQKILKEFGPRQLPSGR